MFEWDCDGHSLSNGSLSGHLSNTMELGVNISCNTIHWLLLSKTDLTMKVMKLIYIVIENLSFTIALICEHYGNGLRIL